MKAKLISLSLFALLGCGWYENNLNLIEFYSYIVWLIFILTIACGFYLSYIIKEFDDGCRDKGTIKQIKEASKGGVVYGFTVGLITTLASIYMLIDTSFTLTAFAVLFSYLISAKLKLSIRKRRKILESEL